MKRVFLALEIGSMLSSEIQTIQKELQPSTAKVKWVDPESVHLTLHFFGDLSEPMLRKSIHAISKASIALSPAMTFRLDTVGSFPSNEKPRVIWLGLCGDLKSLFHLQNDIATRLQDEGFPIESRPFRPHLTLGRVKQFNRDLKLSESIKNYAIFPKTEICIDRISLIESVLTSSGPRYSSICTILLAQKNVM